MSSNNPIEKRRGSSTEQLDEYTDRNGVTWLGKIREFTNMPIFTYDPLGHVGHILVDGAVVMHNTDVATSPLLVRHNADVANSLWFPMYERRCELEVYCRYHGLPVPKARSAELPRNTPQEIVKVCSQLEQENQQMQ